MIASKVRLFQNPDFSEAAMLQICKYLRQFKDAVQVMLYNGDGRSSGTVLIICDDYEICKNFAHQVTKYSQRPECMSMTSAETRFGALEELIPHFSSWRAQTGIQVSPDAFFDIFVFPPDWREQCGELSVVYYHPVPFYIKNLSKKEPVAVL